MAPPRKPAAKTTAAKPAGKTAAKSKATRVALHGRAGQVADWDPDAYSVAVEFDDEPGVFPHIQVAQLTVAA